MKSGAEKRVLVITYYWPPSGGPGVQRWLKFVKYLPQFGWKPFVYTPDNPSYDIKDASLEKDIPEEAVVIKAPIWEPYNFFGKLSKLFSGKKSEGPVAAIQVKKKSWFHVLSTWIRGNLIIPDPRVFWVNPSVRFLERYIRENNIGVIITTGPPHSVHLIGLKLKGKIKSLKWLADFRDPWSEWGFLESLNMGRRAKKIHQRLEKKVLTTADNVLTVTDGFAEGLKRISARNINILTNGFDHDDFREFPLQKTSTFTIRHAGTISDRTNPWPFLEAVKQLCSKYPYIGDHMCINFIGDVHPEFISSVENDEILSRITTFTRPVSHDEIIELYGESSLLLLLVTEYKGASGYIHAKTFEYLATGLPILAIGPRGGETDRMLRECEVRRIFSSDERVEIRQEILDRFNAWRIDNERRRNERTYRQYSRRVITEKLAGLLARMSHEAHDVHVHTESSKARALSR